MAVSGNLFDKVMECKVLDEESLSPHRYVVTSFKQAQERRRERWLRGPVDSEKLANYLTTVTGTIFRPHSRITRQRAS